MGTELREHTKAESLSFAKREAYVSETICKYDSSQDLPSLDPSWCPLRWHAHSALGRRSDQREISVCCSRGALLELSSGNRRSAARLRIACCAIPKRMQTCSDNKSAESVKSVWEVEEGVPSPGVTAGSPRTLLVVLVSLCICATTPITEAYISQKQSQQFGNENSLRAARLAFCRLLETFLTCTAQHFRNDKPRGYAGHRRATWAAPRV